MDFNRVRKLALKLAASPALSVQGRKTLNSLLTSLPTYLCGEDKDGLGEKLLSQLMDACNN
jgi:hypothetical protein